MAIVDRKLVESFLRINHLDVRAPEAELKTIFVEARWSDEEIKAALKICEEVSKEKKDEKKEKDVENKQAAEKKKEKKVEHDSEEENDDEIESEESDGKEDAEKDREDVSKDKEDKRDKKEQQDDASKEDKKKVKTAPVIKKKQRKFWRSEYVGTDIVVDPQAFQISKVVRKREPKHVFRRMIVALGTMLLAVTVAAGVGVGLMWFFEIGPFYIHANNLL